MIESVIDEVVKYIDDILINNECDLSTKKKLIQKYATNQRFDSSKVVFLKRMLQTVLLKSIRNRITVSLFAKFVGFDEGKFARELYMNMDQIKCMKRDGMYIGLHGYDHYWLGNLPKEEMEVDY